MKIRLLFFILLVGAVMSCTKDNASGTKIYYVLKATYDNPQDHNGMINAELTNVALTMPTGSNSVSLNLLTPHTTAEREYKSGMTVTATAESVLTHVTVTLEIWKNGVKWKQGTTMGSDSYAVVTISGTI